MYSRTAKVTGAAALVTFLAVTTVRADGPLSIHDIQYTISPDGASDYANQVVDCRGGIVVAKYPGWRPRLVLQDPNDPAGWGGIQVKDWIYPFDLFNGAEIGDWVTFANMFVEEFRGTTILQRQAAYNPAYTIVSRANPLPPPRLVSVADIAAPLEGPPGEWYVVDHAAEYLESMRLLILDVELTELNLGKAVDNYNLRDALGFDCWASDYMNADATPPYHAFTTPGQHFAAVGGVLEQYTNLVEGWDYYQLLPQATCDLAIYGDLNCDGRVDFADINPFVVVLIDPHNYAVQFPACNPLAGDGTADGLVDFADITPFVVLLTGG